MVCIFLYCASNKGHKTPKSQDYPTAPGHGMGSERLYEVYFPISPLQPATESAAIQFYKTVLHLPLTFEILESVNLCNDVAFTCIYESVIKQC